MEGEKEMRSWKSLKSKRTVIVRASVSFRLPERAGPRLAVFRANRQRNLHRGCFTSLLDPHVDVDMDYLVLFSAWS